MASEKESRKASRSVISNPAARAAPSSISLARPYFETTSHSHSAIRTNNLLTLSQSKQACSTCSPTSCSHATKSTPCDGSPLRSPPGPLLPYRQSQRSSQFAAHVEELLEYISQSSSPAASRGTQEALGQHDKIPRPRLLDSDNEGAPGQQRAAKVSRFHLGVLARAFQALCTCH